MKTLVQSLAAMTMFALVSAASVPALGETAVTLSKVHICCKGCAVAVEKAVTEVEHVKAKIDDEEGTVVVTGETAEGVQEAVDNIAAAGFYGKIVEKDSKIKFPKDELPKEKVTRLELAGIHNCCPACTKAIKGALSKVKGVSGDSVKNKATDFVVEGDFLAKDVIAALHKAGFHASLPKEEEEEKKGS